MKGFAWIATLTSTILTIYLLSLCSWWSIIPALFMITSPFMLSEESVGRPGYEGNAWLFFISTTLWMAGCAWLFEQGNWHALSTLFLGAIQALILLWYSYEEDSYGAIVFLIVGWLVYAIFFSDSQWLYSIVSLVLEIAMLLIVLFYSTIRLVGKAAKAVVEWVIYKVIDLFTIKESISSKVPAAFKAEILKKKRNAVRVGIFEEVDNKYTSTIEITSDEGVSEELYEGLVFTL